jgi:hypothetical protein
MIGKPEQVDKEALREKEFDRVKIKCRKPEAINCSIEYFFGDVGYFVTF